MFLQPSSIHFTNTEETKILQDANTDSKMDELSKRLLENGGVPKLQVTEKDGQFFTLNNTNLQVFRWMESVGRVKSIQVESVPLSVVPEGIRQLMTVSSSPKAISSKENRDTKVITYKPIEHRKTCWVNDDDANDESGSDDTDGESDSELDPEDVRRGPVHSSEELSGEEDSLL
ncbi:uncharacterized protein LOC121379951 [Gigantopelta aegis]|uniref:uncharacterized protein LOC121379951 n=1 Tax=Gigantopelta aegis TaxID=1735272 RepID=UPI001B88908F|nr:uncharacterized protein LOC121379951 [Gigantopelta aegis]